MTKRRTLFKVMSATGLTSVTWAKPVVDSVLLPAHAQISNPDTAEPPVTAASFECIGSFATFDSSNPLSINFDGTSCERVYDQPNEDTIVFFRHFDLPNGSEINAEYAPAINSNWTTTSPNDTINVVGGSSDSLLIDIIFNRGGITYNLLSSVNISGSDTFSIAGITTVDRIP